MNSARCSAANTNFPSSIMRCTAAHTARFIFKTSGFDLGLNTHGGWKLDEEF